MSVDLKPKTLKRKNFKKLSLNAETQPSQSAADPVASQPFTLDKPTLQRAPSAGNLMSQMASLELGVEFKIDIRAQDLRTIQELGAGNGGSVSRVEHTPTGSVMAKKVIHIEAKEAVRRQILRELHIMHECDSPYIVSFYGAFINESSGDVVMCMEFMDCGSLDRIYKKAGPLTEEIVGHITVAVVEGLTYLYNEHRIVHRDVKPSNILVNSHGQIKLCDFGVSGELINSIADTFVGTSTYMSPERIQGGNYTVKSDVWSLGISLLELLLGRFPFDVANSAVGPMGILDLLQRIVNEPPPTLPAEDTRFSPVCRRFVDRCLYKEAERPSPQQLVNDAFMITARAKQVDMKAWAMSVQ